MTNRFLLDSGLLIRLLRRDQRAADLIAHLASIGRVATSVVVVLEVLRGCRSIREESAAEALFGQVDVVELTYDLAVATGRVLREWPGVFSSDRAVPDAIITASAIAASATLVTLNTRQFSRLSIPELELVLIDQQAEDWIPRDS